MPLLMGGAWTNPAPPTAVPAGGVRASLPSLLSTTGPHPQGASGIPMPERYWFVASDLALADGTVLAAQSWYSRGGSNEALIVNVAGHGPTYRSSVATLNNQPALQFDVTVGQQMAAFSQNALVGVNGATVFIAAYQTGVTGGGPMLFMASTATAGNDRFNIGAQTTTGKPQLLTRRLDADTLTTNTASSGGFQQASVIRAVADYFSNSGSLYVNGSAVLSGVSVSSSGGGGTTSVTQNNGFFIGCSNDSTANSGGGFTGYIAEVIIYDRVLPAEDIATVEAYLTAKYIPTTTIAGSITLGGSAGSISNATSSGSLSLSGTSNASSAVSSAGSVTLDGAATGSAGGTPTTAAGALTLSGSSAWVIPASTGSIALSGTVTAQAAGTVSGALTLGGVASWVVAAVSGSVTLTGSATATGTSGSSASGSVTLAGTAAATAVVAATGSIALAGSVNASASVTIVGSITFDATATASGSGVSPATASGSLTLNGLITSGIAGLVYIFTPGISGYRRRLIKGLETKRAPSVYRRNGVWGYVLDPNAQFVASCEYFYPSGASSIVPDSVASEMLTYGFNVQHVSV